MADSLSYFSFQPWYVLSCMWVGAYKRPQWRRKVPKSVCVWGGGGGGRGTHRYIIYVPSVKNQYKLDAIGYMVIYVIAICQFIKNFHKIFNL